jgi:hypothetical protein
MSAVASWFLKAEAGQRYSRFAFLLESSRDTESSRHEGSDAAYYAADRTITGRINVGKVQVMHSSVNLFDHRERRDASPQHHGYAR